MSARAPLDGNGGGYDYEFVKTPSDTLICTICFLPSREPHLSACCGHTFCKSCLEGSKKFNVICPVCHSEEFPTMFNKQADRVIRSLHVFCTNKKQGCEWKGEVNGITNHLGNCLCQVFPCPNDCSKSLQRQYLTSHIETECPRRTVNCQYCNDVGEYQFIEGQHKEECPKFPVQCPNECEIESIHRDEVEEHREVCPLEIIQCEYHVVGCEVEMAHKDMNTHKQEMMEVHLSLSINELMETRKQFQLTQNNFKCEVEKTKDDLTQQLMLHTTKIADTEQQLATSQQRAKMTKDELTVLAENYFSSANKQLTLVKQAADIQHATIENLKQQLTVSQQEVKVTIENLTLQLAHTEKNLTAKLMANQQEAKRTTDQLLQKLTATEKELNTTKQQLATTCQNLTKAEKEYTTLAASTGKAVAEMENKFQAKVVTAAEKKLAELETKLQQRTELIEEIILDPWGTSLHCQASKSSSGGQVVPVVVKMIEFTKHMAVEWCSALFYDNCNKKHKIQLIVSTDINKLLKAILGTSLGTSLCTSHNDSDGLLVALVVDNIEGCQPANQFEVMLLNQKSNNQHCSVLTSLKCKDLMFTSLKTLHYNSLVTYLISLDDLYQITPTCQFLKDDTLFFEVLPKS